MNAVPSLDALVNNLKLLCSQPSVTGQAPGLADGADGAASILRDAGLDCRVVKTDGAPVVLGQRNVGAARTILVYGRYDVPPAGLRRAWTSDPFQPTVRDGALYARGAVVKAELVARAAALRTLIQQQIPANIMAVVEGESLIGSPHLGDLRSELPACDAVLWSGGGFDANNLPLLYTGIKGLLQVELQANAANTVIPETYAATVPNPAWTLVLALASIKSEFEEILIEGFYDEIVPPHRVALNAVQRLDVGEQARRAAWDVQHFLANVSGAMLARIETFSPTCNISAFNFGGSSDLPAIPRQAQATLHFQLVPDLRPDRLFELLVQHLASRGFATLQVTQLPGAYAPTQGPELAFDAGQAAVKIFGTAAPVVPLTPFAAPAALLAADKPLISCGLERPSSALFGQDEHVPLQDLVAHAQLTTELLVRLAV